VADVVAHGSDHDAKHVLRSEKAARTPCSVASSRPLLLGWALPQRLAVFEVEQKFKAGNDADGVEERIRRLEDIDRVDVVVVRVWCVIDGADSEQEAVHLVWMSVEPS